MQLNCIYTVFLVFFSIANENFALSTKDIETINGLINNYMTLHKIPGGSFALSHNGTMTSRGFGMRNVENIVEADAKTHFLIGSISKSITSLIVAKVLDDKYPGNVDAALDVPIKTFLPSDVMLSDRLRTDSISFRDLLAHRSCVNPSALSSLVFDSHDGVDDYIYRARYRLQNCYFRATYVYSNVMFDMAGHYISLIAGKSIKQLFEEFFQTLGMTSSRVVQGSDQFESMPDFALPYIRNPTGEQIRYNSSLLRRLKYSTAAGGVSSTAEDMVKYLHFLLTMGKNTQGVQIYPEAVVRSTRKTSIPVNFDTGVDEIDSYFGYGLGLILGTRKGNEIIGHNGYFPPYSSEMTLYPGLNIGIYTSFNGPGSTHFQAPLHTNIFNVLVGNDLVSASPKKPKSPSILTEFKIKSKIAPVLKPNTNRTDSQVKSPHHQRRNAEHAGLYGNQVHGNIIIEFRPLDPQGELYVRDGTWGTGYLTQMPVGYHLTIDTDLIHDNWAEGITDDSLVFWMDFPDSDTLHFGDETYPVIFKRDETIDKFPSQIWDPNSCAPE